MDTFKEMILYHVMKVGIHDKAVKKLKREFIEKFVDFKNEETVFYWDDFKKKKEIAIIVEILIDDKCKTTYKILELYEEDTNFQIVDAVFKLNT